jgi:transposase
MIAVCRLRYCERTRAYAQRRTAEGKTKREIIRCLKRYIARELYHALRADLADLELPAPTPPPPTQTAIAVSINCGAGPNGRTRRRA